MCGAKIAYIRGDFICVKACNRGVRIVIEKSRRWSMSHIGVGVRYNVVESNLRFPGLGQDAIQRAQSKAARFLQGDSSCRLQISRDAQRVPTHINGLVDVWRWA